MKIAHIVCTFPPYYGGMGNVVYQLASALDNLGHENTVFTPQYGMESPPIEERIKIKRLAPAFTFGNAAYLPQIQEELNDFDLVHLHYPFFGTANLVRRWKLKNPTKPLVITYHMDNRAQGWKGIFFQFYAKFWLPRILHVADCLLASSLDYIEASDAGASYQLEKSKWQELPFGVDVDRFQPQEKSEKLFERYQLDINLPTLLFVGGMDGAHYFKGIPFLLKAVSLLKKENKNVQLILVGDGSLREQYQATALFLGVKDRVRFVGQIDDEQLPSCYNLADLLVLPSINRGEAFGMVLLEAMASGVPIIASDLPGVRKVAADGGMVCPPENAQALAELIGDFFQNPEQMSEWKTHVRQVAEEKYSWDIIAERMSDIYVGLADEKGI